jgi:signal transduction histidine kinase
MMGVELLRFKYPAESQVVDLFEASAKRGADMVRQLLTFAKGAEGERAALQVGRLVKELEKLMAGSFPKNIQLVVRCEPDLPTVLGDATQVHQILLNLCVNARDAMPKGGTLTLEAQRTEVDAAFASSVADARPGHYLAVRVQDTGTGIPQEILDRIFDPFFTTKRSGQRHRPGPFHRHWAGEKPRRIPAGLFAARTGFHVHRLSARQRCGR